MRNLRRVIVVREADGSDFVEETTVEQFDTLAEAVSFVGENHLLNQINRWYAKEIVQSARAQVKWEQRARTGKKIEELSRVRR